MKYVNVEAAITELLRSKGKTAVLTLPEEPETPCIWIAKTGGVANGMLAQDRIQICAITEGRKDSRDLADEVLAILLESPHIVPPYGLLDHVTVEGTPVEVELENNLKNNLFTIAVDTRAS